LFDMIHESLDDILERNFKLLTISPIP
jgi:hypothetical protein